MIGLPGNSRLEFPARQPFSGQFAFKRFEAAEQLLQALVVVHEPSSLYDSKMRLAAFLGALLTVLAAGAQPLPKGIRFQHGAASNTVLIGATTAVYGATSAKVTRVLLTHVRRDVLSASAAPVVVPAAERESAADPQAFWEKLETARFHDYAQQTTKAPVQPLRVETYRVGWRHA